MASSKLILALLLCFMMHTCFGQASKYDLSAPTDLKQTGWNKVLCMNNGNTLLFNFDRNKPVIVKVFDSLHKEVASERHTCSLLDIMHLETMEFKGLYEIGGEAVLFLEQEHQGKPRLIMLRFDGVNGKLIEEKPAGESQSMAKKTQFYVMKNREDSGYAILFCTDVPQFKQCNLHVTYYNSMREQIKDVPLDVDRKKYDYLFVVGSESLPDGISITLNLTILVTNQTVSSVSPEKAIYDHHIAMYFIPTETGKVSKSVVDVSTDVYPNYAKATINPFAKTINLLLYSYRQIRYRFGLNLQRGSVSDNLFFISDRETGGVKLNYVKNDLVTSYLREKTDTSKIFYGVPLAMFTNDNGLSTVITESYERYDEPETRVRYNHYTHLGNIGITQLNDDGSELWGTLLPHAECFKSYQRFYHPIEFAKKREIGYPFYDLPEQDYERQFLSLNTYSYNRNIFVVYNDYDKNFNDSIGQSGDTVYTFEHTNACYYKLDRKRVVTKHHLYGAPSQNEYACSFLEGADFDNKKGVYASLVQYTKEGDVSLRMAWVHLD